MDEAEPTRRTVALFVERFDDFFSRGVFPAIALGVMLTMVWMGLTEGYPVFMDGRVDLASVVALLVAFACLCLLASAFDRVASVLRNPAVWVGAGCTMLVSSALLLALFFQPHLLSPALYLTVVRLLVLVLGLGCAVLVMVCATAFACLKPVSAGVGFVFSIAVTFVVYFCLNACEQHLAGALFCLLPFGASLCLLKARRTIVERLDVRPPEKLSLAKGFRSMCLSFCVFFFAIGAKCAFEPVSEFSTATDTSIVGIMMVSLLFLYLIAVKRPPMGVFHVLKLFYSTAVMVLTICIALAPLSLEPFVGVVYNADVVVIIMVLWLLTTFVAHANEVYVCRVVGLAFGAAAIGMALGWFTGIVLYDILGHDRSYPTIAIACATAVFSTVGFSGRSFPYLTHKGEGAKKMRKAAASFKPVDYCHEVAEQCHLSDREEEVLELLIAGYGADAVSEKLVISYHTARTHVRNIYKKMDVHSQRELLDGYEAAKAQLEGESPA